MKREPIRVRPADDRYQVATYQGGDGFCHRPCPTCLWRRDAELGAFPAEAYRLSAHTAYDMSAATFACHNTPTGAKICAGFLLRGSVDNLGVRMRVAEYAGNVTSNVDLYGSYREMAIANGVDPDDPALAPCRGDGRWDWDTTTREDDEQ